MRAEDLGCMSKQMRDDIYICRQSRRSAEQVPQRRLPHWVYYYLIFFLFFGGAGGGGLVGNIKKRSDNLSDESRRLAAESRLFLSESQRRGLMKREEQQLKAASRWETSETPCCTAL